MRPIVLLAHSRPISVVKFNRDGDLVFAGSKDGKVSLWNALSGEALGCYDVESAVTNLDISPDSQFLLTTLYEQVKLWNVRTGELLETYYLEGNVNSVSFDENGTHFVVVSKQQSAYKIRIFSILDEPRNLDPVRELSGSGANPTVVRWVNFRPGEDGRPDETAIIVGYADGRIDALNPNDLATSFISAAPHTMAITDLYVDPRRFFLLSSSKDRSSKLLDLPTFEILKNYQTNLPINTGVIYPFHIPGKESFTHVFLGGGQEAINVTQTHDQKGNFDVHIFDMVHENEEYLVPGHFGTLNTLDISPDGMSFVSGAEDGFVRLVHLDHAALQRLSNADEQKEG